MHLLLHDGFSTHLSHKHCRPHPPSVQRPAALHPCAGGGSSGRASPSQLLSGAPYSPRYGCLISGSSGREYDAGSDQEEAALALRSVPRSASPRALMSSGGGVSAAEARQQVGDWGGEGCACVFVCLQNIAWREAEALCTGVVSVEL